MTYFKLRGSDVTHEGRWQYNAIKPLASILQLCNRRWLNKNDITGGEAYVTCFACVARTKP